MRNSCFGNRCRLSGQNLVPLPPAMITGYRRPRRFADRDVRGFARLSWRVVALIRSLTLPAPHLTSRGLGLQNQLNYFTYGSLSPIFLTDIVNRRHNVREPVRWRG